MNDNRKNSLWIHCPVCGGKTRTKVYEDNVSGKIDDARFAKMAKRYEQEQGEAAGKIKALRLELKKADGKQMDMDFFLETIRRYTDATTITKRSVS
ncbi:cysteine-rich KTR domain-containing protein [Intestinimonas butyriciproducens]|uniref:cysteine-rich KTR domain-containing protein n=1 Tax=Intestinimonas butyriciproducens TaxID=1297617 RepID=UPI00051B32DF|nr:cysteine-rich KTR domain-containing protein [Intestinimonas butyriciproducens]